MRSWTPPEWFGRTKALNLHVEGSVNRAIGLEFLLKLV